MNELEFRKGWTLLLAQPWARDYVFDEDKAAIQFGVYSKAFAKVPVQVWRDAISFWIENEDHWPLIPQLRTHINRLIPKNAVEPLTFKQIAQAPEDPDSEPYRSICTEWAKRGSRESVYTVGIPILREHLRRCPQDLVAAERLRGWEQIEQRENEAV